MLKVKVDGSLIHRPTLTLSLCYVTHMTSSTEIARSLYTTFAPKLKLLRDQHLSPDRMSYHSTVFSGNKSGAIVDLFSVMLNILGSEVVLSELNDKGFH